MREHYQIRQQIYHHLVAKVLRLEFVYELPALLLNYVTEYRIQLH